MLTGFAIQQNHDIHASGWTDQRYCTSMPTLGGDTFPKNLGENRVAVATPKSSRIAPRTNCRIAVAIETLRHRYCVCKLIPMPRHRRLAGRRKGLHLDICRPAAIQ